MHIKAQTSLLVWAPSPNSSIDYKNNLNLFQQQNYRLKTI